MTPIPKSTLVAVTIVIIVAFALGRLSAPDVSTTSSQTTNTEKHQDKDVHEVVEETHLPDGTVKVKKTIDSSTKTDVEKSSTKQTEKIVAPTGSKVNVSGIIANDGFRSLTPIYGVSVSKEIIGPITAGVFGLTNGIIGASVGINF